MNRSTRRCLVLGLTILAASTGIAVSVWSAKAQSQPGCPQNLCACLGAAAKYTVVSNKFYGGPGTLQQRGSGYRPELGGFAVDASVCATKARLHSRVDYGEGNIGEDLILLAPKGIAGRFEARTPAGYAS